MNTNNNNWNQQSPYGEPAFVDGIAGQKQESGEPQFITPLNAEHTRPDPYHPIPQHDQTVPLYGEQQKPIYADQISATNMLYPGQDNFLGKQLKFVDGKEVLTTGGVVQAAYVPPSHGEEHKDEHLSPEHLHIKLGLDVAVEQVIRIKPDGEVQVITEKVEDHLDTHHHKKEHDDTHHHKKEHDDTHHHKKEHDDTHHHKKEHVEKEKIKTKKVSKKKKHSTRKSNHDVAPTETVTVVKVSEHEPGTAGYDKEGKLGKHDDTHHGKKEHDDSHHSKKEHVDTHHHSKKEHDDSHHSKKEHVDTHKKEHVDTHNHGKKEHVDTHKEVKSRTITSD